MKRIVLFLSVIAALQTSPLLADDKRLVLSTIKPVHALVSAIAGDTADTAQIIPDYASPHSYSFKPSDLRRLSKADLVFRIDEHMESFLNKSLTSIAKDKLVSLSDSEGLVLLKANHSHDEHETHAEHENYEEHDDHEEHEEHEAHDSHDMDNHDEHHEAENAAENDYHLWLDPNNAIAMVKQIRDHLIKMDAKNTEQYTKNAEQLIDAITQKDEAISKQLSGVADSPFIVMHDAWQYFSKHYKLNQLSSVTLQEDLRASAKAISEAREMIRSSGVTCVVTEPNFRLDTLKVLTADFKVNTAQIDPLGRSIAISSQSYPELLQDTADKLLSCLQKDNTL